MSLTPDRLPQDVLPGPIEMPGSGGHEGPLLCQAARSGCSREAKPGSLSCGPAWARQAGRGASRLALDPEPLGTGLVRRAWAGGVEHVTHTHGSSFRGPRRDSRSLSCYKWRPDFRQCSEDPLCSWGKPGGCTGPI